MLVSMSIALPPPEVLVRSFEIREDRNGREALQTGRDRRDVATGGCSDDAIRQIGLSEVTYYRWRREFGGLKTEQVKRLKDLELENTRLRKAVSELTLDKLILQEVRKQRYFSERPAGAALA
jgi:putative transposase